MYVLFLLIASSLLCQETYNCPRSSTSRSCFRSLRQNANTIKAHKTANPACSNIDFELSPLGSITSSTDVPFWTVNQLTMPYSFCYGTPSVTGFSYYNSAVVTLPLNDPNMLIQPSPLGGNNILRLNAANASGVMTSISQSFTVSTSNNVFNYVYMACFALSTHSCCESPAARVLFRDSSGTILSSISETITGVMASCSVSPIGWATNNQNTVTYTPSWINRTVDLTPYIGSVIEVEVIVTDCAYGGHPGYLYFDAKCYPANFTVNGTLAVSNSYSSCATNATISAPPGFTNYSWSGPSTSTISGATSSTISTNGSGVYTVNCLNGNTSLTTALTLSLSNSSSSCAITPSIVLACPGSSIMLYASGNGVSSYTWNNTMNSDSLLISSINSAATVSLSAKDYLGCIFQSTASLNAYTLPVVLISASQATVCSGSSVMLAAASNSAVSWTWSTGDTTTFINPSVFFPTTFIVNGSDNNGCSTTNSITIFTSPCIGIKENNPKENDLLIYPNPSTGEFSIRAPHAGTIKIINSLGGLVAEETLNQKSEAKFVISVKGLYLILFNNKVNKLIVGD